MCFLFEIMKLYFVSGIIGLFGFVKFVECIVCIIVIVMWFSCIVLFLLKLIVVRFLCLV